MKLKNIKKAIAMFSMVAVSVASLGMNVAVANGSVATSVTPDTSGGSITDPIRIKAKWEMKGPCFGSGSYNYCAGIGEGKDDSMADGAQFAAPGQWGANMNYTVCAIVHGPGKTLAILIKSLPKSITQIRQCILQATELATPAAPRIATALK